MSEPSIKATSEFDAYAAEYDAILASALSISGEDKNYFASGRVVRLARCLARLQTAPRTALDFGCGIGSATPFLLNEFNLDALVGVDVSVQSLAIARDKHDDRRVRFVHLAEYRPEGRFDLVYCNGVFHHISASDHVAVMDTVYSSLRPGGLFGFWENNPWNPGTRYAMHRNPFDRHAVPLSPLTARHLLRECGFEMMRTDFLFFFPRFLKWFRCLEPSLACLPLGAQYQILCRKPKGVRQSLS